MKRKFLLVLLFASSIVPIKAAINQIRWGSSGDPLNGLTITWSNTGAADSIKWGYTSSYEKGSFAGVKRNGYTSGTSFFKHTFPSPVTPSSTIYYTLYDSGTKGWGAQKTFATAPPLSTKKFSFCALGDSRSNVSTVWKNVSNLANAKKTALTVYNGDITSSGNSASQYDAWFTHGAVYLENNIVYHSLGNHDVAGATFYTNIYDLPKVNGSNLYYSFKYANAIFITLNSEAPGNAAQATWLANTLKEADEDPTIMWKVISFHKPLFNIGDHASEMNSYRSTWWKAFDDYGVDLILNGHDHNYQRTKPVNLKVSSSAPVAKYGSGAGEGRCQIICGGAGAPLYGKGSSSDAWAMNTFNETFNYVYCEVEDCKLVVTAYNSSGTVIETFTLDKSASADCITTSITQKPEKFNPIRVVPNPSEGNFTLQYSSDLMGGAIVKIYDIAGKEVASQKVIKTAVDMEFRYDLTGYAAGIYTVSVFMEGQRDNAMLIVK